MSLTCTQFRHQLKPELFRLQVRWDREARRANGAIDCRVSADNLPTPAKFTLPIAVDVERGDINAEI